MELIFPLRATFLALPLENEAKWRFQALQEALKPFEEVLRFQNPQSPHLTLNYWKEVMEIEYKPIIQQAEKIVSKTKPFALHALQADTFSHRGEDHVLFLTVAFSEELARLKKACPWPEGREFTPHITIAHISHPQRFATKKKQVMKALRDCMFDIPVDRLRLYAEIDGRKQTPLQDFAFSG